MTVVDIRIGDCLESLRLMESESVQCVVTSPPYWGLRDYGTASWAGGDAECDHKGRSQTSSASTLGEWKSGGGQEYKEATGGMPFRHQCGKCGAERIDAQRGLELTPDLYVVGMVEVFREVRRVLKDDGTLWLNLGDCYVDGGRGTDVGSTLSGSRRNQAESRKAVTRETYKALPPKNLVGIPWRVAFALQADGWYLRSDIIWAKPNPMPESVTDRPTKSHEYLFLLTKSERYLYDYEAVREPISQGTIDRISQPNLLNQEGSARAHAGGKTNGNMKPVLRKSGNKQRDIPSDDDGRGIPNDHLGRSIPWEGTMRNRRSVWTVTTVPFKGAHFATFPPKLIEPCILAGAPRGGVVLDPFGGAGTTGLVAQRLGRSAILLELNPGYAALARKRIDEDGAHGYQEDLLGAG